MELSIVRVVLVNVLLLLVQQVFTSDLEPTIAEKDDDLFPVSIIHINDFHARYFNNFY